MFSNRSNYSLPWLSYYTRFFWGVLATTGREALTTQRYESPIIQQIDEIQVGRECQQNGTCQLSELMDGVQGFMLEAMPADDICQYSLGPAGDVNGDGLGDILVGICSAQPNGKRYAGSTYLLFGSSRPTWGDGVLNFDDLLDGTYGIVFEGENPYQYSGISVSGAGDINGDGFSDFMIAAYETELNNPIAGIAYVILGSDKLRKVGNDTLTLKTLIDGKHAFVLKDTLMKERKTLSVSKGGDINGDGLGDLIIGPNWRQDYYAGSGESGPIHVVFGSNSPTAWGNGTLYLDGLMNGARGFQLEGDPRSIVKCDYATTAGDFNGDGLGDIVIGASYLVNQNPVFNPSIIVYLILGSRDPKAWANGRVTLDEMVDGINGFMLTGKIGDGSVTTVNSAGDINGDGLGDIVIGLRSADINGWSNAGKTYVIFGSRDPTLWRDGILELSKLANGKNGFVLEGQETESYSGVSVSSAGDINGDGFGDLLIGASGEGSGNWHAAGAAGKTYVVLGTNNSSTWGNGTLSLKTMINTGNAFVLQGERNDRSGKPVSLAGDINGDGLGDFLVGAIRSHIARFTGTNKVYVILSYKVIDVPRVVNTTLFIIASLLMLVLGALGTCIGCARFSRRRIDAAINLHRVGLLEETEHYQQNTLKPIAKAILQKLNIRGCGIQSPEQSREYLNAINSIITALILQDIETDLSKLTTIQRKKLLVQITDAVHIELIGQRRCGSRVWCTSFFKTAVTASQIQDAAEQIALRVKEGMSSEHKLHSGVVQMSMFHHNEASILHHAIRSGKGKAEIDALLAASPACLTQRNAQGQLPVDVAAKAGACEVVELLLAKGSPGDQAELVQQALTASQAVEYKSPALLVS